MKILWEFSHKIALFCQHFNKTIDIKKKNCYINKLTGNFDECVRSAKLEIPDCNSIGAAPGKI